MRRARRSALRPVAPPAPQKLVLMNPAPLGIGRVPEPTRPVDDFSVALWAFAELVLEKTSLEVAQIHYFEGRNVHNLYSKGRPWEFPPSTVVAFIRFYPDAAVYMENLARNAWTLSAQTIEVQADGELILRADGSARGFTHALKRVGNLLTWKFKKSAFESPRNAS